MPTLIWATGHADEKQVDRIARCLSPGYLFFD